MQFTFVEAVDLQLVVAPSSVSGKAELYKDLIEEFSALPKKAKEVNYDNYSVINVSPPVVPNPYVPTFRVFSYNVSEHGEIQGKKRKHRHDRGKHGDKGSECKKEPYKNSWKCHLNEPWHSDPYSPSRRNQRWTPLGYAQVRRVETIISYHHRLADLRFSSVLLAKPGECKQVA